MLAAMVPTIVKLLRISLPCCYSQACLSVRSVKYPRPSQYFYCTDERRLQEENKKTLDMLYNLSVDVTKIRRLKAWVLLQDKAYVDETATILKDMGATKTAVASILERCPEAILQSPDVINAQKEIWRSVYHNDLELVKMIEKFPDSFFSNTPHENQKGNIDYFQELGMNKKIISRFLASAPEILCNNVENNKHIIKALQESYLKFGGSEANMKIWLIKLLCQDPFILSKPVQAVENNLQFLQKLGFTDSEVLKLLSKLKGFLFDLTNDNMEKSALYTKQIFKCTNEEFKGMVFNCPALLYYSVPVLQERISEMLKEGISLDQIKEFPLVLELTPQILQHRVKKILVLGYNIKHLNLEHLSGTKKDFEVRLNKKLTNKERPLFNPVAPLNVDE